jgi:pimeloyl-ACP methyl ester carboxylesterase
MTKNKLKVIGNLTPHKFTVLFIPGGMCSPAVYEDIEIPAYYQSAIIDWSKSEGPWDIEVIGERIGSLIEEMELGPTVLVGYSAGGAIALSSAIGFPDKVAGLLVSNTGANTRGHGDPHFPNKIVRHWGELEFIEAFLARCFANEIPQDLKDKLVKYINEIEMEAAYYGAFSLRKLDLEHKISSIRCPVVIAHGVDDVSRTREHAQLLKDKIPHAKLVWLTGGHTIMVENKRDWQKELHELLYVVHNKSNRRFLTIDYQYDAGKS